MSEFRAGFVNLLGRTNVGKSTFINRVLGQKVSITSRKPQTTRNRITCIFEAENAQIVFLDTPGFHEPSGTLGKYIVKQARKGLKGADVIVYMVEPWGKVDEKEESFLHKVEGVNCPKMLLVNKIDVHSLQDTAETLRAYEDQEVFQEFVPISARTGDGVEIAIEQMVQSLPAGDRLFPKGTTIDKPLSFLVSEFVREKVFNLTYEELPYSVETMTRYIDEREDKNLIEMAVDMYVVRKSQKGIIIGKNGSMIKEIGVQAREDLEKMLGKKVYLDLKVKVSKNWNKKSKKVEWLTGSTDLQEDKRHDKI